MKYNIIWLVIAGGLLGITQQIALVLLPILADRLAISYTTLVNYQAAGSFLFLFSAPFWAKKVDKLGINRVLSFGLSGYLISALLLTLIWLYADWLGTSSATLLIGFIVSRIFYGLFASAIVPQVQNISLSLRQSQPVAALAQVNLGGTLSRCLTPLLAGGLVIVSPLMVLLLPVIFVVFVLLMQPKVDDGKAEGKPGTPQHVMPWGLLILAFTTALSLCFGQFSLAPKLMQLTQLTVYESAHYIAYTLSATALLTTLGQLYFVKRVKTDPNILLRWGFCLVLINGLIAHLVEVPMIFCFAIALLFLGCNWLTLGYSAKLVQSGSNKTTSWIATIHTLGYGVGAMLINFSISASYLLIVVLLSFSFAAYLASQIYAARFKAA